MVSSKWMEQTLRSRCTTLCWCMCSTAKKIWHIIFLNQQEIAFSTWGTNSLVMSHPSAKGPVGLQVPTPTSWRTCCSSCKCLDSACLGIKWAWPWQQENLHFVCVCVCVCFRGDCAQLIYRWQQGKQDPLTLSSSPKASPFEWGSQIVPHLENWITTNPVTEVFQIVRHVALYWAQCYCIACKAQQWDQNDDETSPYYLPLCRSKQKMLSLLVFLAILTSCHSQDCKFIQGETRKHLLLQCMHSYLYLILAWWIIQLAS